jgi:predicted nuclease of predicted toxin-antitoxin system
MKFVVDAPLPQRLARELGAQGHDAVHTADPPAANRTQDREIIMLAIRENRVVIRKGREWNTFLGKKL